MHFMLKDWGSIGQNGVFSNFFLTKGCSEVLREKAGPDEIAHL